MLKKKVGKVQIDPKTNTLEPLIAVIFVGNVLFFVRIGDVQLSRSSTSIL